MSHQDRYIQKLSEQVDTGHHVSVMLDLLRKVQDLVTSSVSFSIRDTSDMLQKVLVELQVLQSERDSVLATLVGED